MITDACSIFHEDGREVTLLKMFTPFLPNLIICQFPPILELALPHHMTATYLYMYTHLRASVKSGLINICSALTINNNSISQGT